MQFAYPFERSAISGALYEFPIAGCKYEKKT